MHSYSVRIQNVVLALGYALRGRRPLHALGLSRMAIEKRIAPNGKGPFQRMPDAAYGLPDGLVNIGGRMTVERLQAAYRLGIFPWRHLPPVKWWTPARRTALFLNESKLDKNARRALRQNRYKVTFDTAFRAVMEACAEPRKGHVPLTWILPPFIEAYTALHEAGDAHSVEVWDETGALVGGLYGVASGGVFFTESQFAIARDASKIAFVTLNRHLAEWGFTLNDGKFMTAHLASLGMREISRAEFSRILAESQHIGGPASPWRADPSLDVANWKPGPGA